MNWIVGMVLVLGTFNHAVVSIEIVFGMRHGADVSVTTSCRISAWPSGATSWAACSSSPSNL